MQIVKRAVHLMLVAGLLVLAWQTAVFGLGVSIRLDDPHAAARVAPDNALVLGSLSQQQLNDDFNAAQRSATLALRRDATNTAAASALSIVYAREGNMPRSAKLLQYAELLSRRDMPTQLWAIEIAVQRDDILDALRHYDIALRVGKTMPPILFPVLDSASTDPEIREPLSKMLAKGTPWKLSFFDYLSSRTKDIQSAALLVDAVYASGGTVSHGPISILIQRLVERGDIAGAWRLYSHENPRAQRVGLRNGNFSMMPELPTPFDWRLEADGDARAEILTSNQEGELHVEAGSGAGGVVATQLLLLPQGSYTLSFRARTGEGGTFGGSTLEILCQATRQRIGQMKIANALKGEALRFTVPGGCTSQALVLTLNSEGMGGSVDGSIDGFVLKSIAHGALQ